MAGYKPAPRLNRTFAGVSEMSLAAWPMMGRSFMHFQRIRHRLGVVVLKMNCFLRVSRHNVNPLERTRTDIALQVGFLLMRVRFVGTSLAE
jgi:hypothetical protein